MMKNWGWNTGEILARPMVFGELSCCLLSQVIQDLSQLGGQCGRFNAINGVFNWDLHFVWAIQDQELESLMTFMDIIYGVVIRGIGRIRCVGNQIRKNGFQVSIFYQLLGAPPSTSHQSFPWKIIWRLKVPLRVAFFVWITALGKILIIDNLRLRKIRITDWCYMCKCNGKSVDHLLLHCSIALDLWSMILGLFGVHQVMPKSVIELLACCGKVSLVVTRIVIF